MLTFCPAFFSLLLIVTTVNCNYLIVKTESGRIQGVEQTTLLNNKKYIAYKGIRYAEPPVGSLRFKVPVPIAPWRETLLAAEYGDACLKVDQSQLLNSNTTKSEDCLFLNIFTPALESNKENARKAVIFFIHGGANTEGDGSNGYYGPDFIVEDDVVLVTTNYRLGPWGFSNFDLKGYTGNMGLKDQQLALEWVKRNIKHFGGDPSSITVCGESTGAVSVHLHMLSERSRKCMKRAILMSGSAFTNFAFYQPNNHIELFKEIFELDANATADDVLQFMLNAPVEVILQKSPAINVRRNVIELSFAAVIEDKRKAESPFLTRNPREIYRTSKVNVDAMFGDTTAEYLSYLNPADLYSWVKPMKNFSNIGLPFGGLTLSPDSPEYREAVKKIYKFYFGTGELLPTLTNLNSYVQMCSHINFVYPVYQALKVHSNQATTFCYENNLQLNLNLVKIKSGLQELAGTSHFEDLLYLFRSNDCAILYGLVLANRTDPTNEKTLRALQFVPKMFTNYAKFGLPGIFGPYTNGCRNCVGITNDGLKPLSGLKSEAMQFWDTIYNSVKPWIVNPL